MWDGCITGSRFIFSFLHFIFRPLATHSRQRAKILCRIEIYLQKSAFMCLTDLIENRPHFIGVFVCFSVSHSLGCRSPLQGGVKG